MVPPTEQGRDNVDSFDTAERPESRIGLIPRDLALIALFAALIAVLGLPGSFALFGSTVPITAQTLAVMLAGSILGAKRGFLAVLAFLVLVAAGLPLMAGGKGGLGVFVGPSGGYVIGWLLGVAVVGALAPRGRGRGSMPWLLLANAIGGIAAIYAIGIPFTALRVDSGVLATIISATQFLPGDILKVILSSLITVGVYQAYPLPAAGTKRSKR